METCLETELGQSPPPSVLRYRKSIPALALATPGLVQTMLWDRGKHWTIDSKKPVQVVLMLLRVFLQWNLAPLYHNSITNPCPSYIHHTHPPYRHQHSSSLLNCSSSLCRASNGKNSCNCNSKSCVRIYGNKNSSNSNSTVSSNDVHNNFSHLTMSHPPKSLFR